MKKIILLILFIFCLSCSKQIEEEIIGEANYKTEYTIYWDTYFYEEKIIYTENEVYTCSFDGTNYLIEKNKKEELFSTTAPIRIKKSEKINKIN